MKHLPSYKALRAFAETVRHGSLTEAARVLNVTPGAISRQITALERDIGHALMHRSRTGLTVTSRGQRLSQSLSAAFRDIEAAVGQAARRGDESLLRLNAYPTFAIQWLMPRLARFHADLPHIDLRIQTSLKPPDLDRDEIDLAIVIAQEIDPSLEHVFLFDRLYAPVCSPSLLQRCQGMALTDAIANERALVTEMQLTFWRRWLREASLPEQILDGAVTFESSSLAWQAARDGAGFAIGQLALLQNDLQSGVLVAPFPNRIIDNRRYYLVGRPSADHGRHLGEVMDWFARQIAASGGRRPAAAHSPMGLGPV